MFYALKSCRQLARIRQRADGRGQNIKKFFQLRLVSDIISSDNIGDICLLEQRFQEIALLIRRGKCEY